MLSAGLACVAAGATILTVAGALWVRDVARRRPFADVLDNIEPPRVVMPLRCICPARLPFCGCAIDGVRNPRGAGRARDAHFVDCRLALMRATAAAAEQRIARERGDHPFTAGAAAQLRAFASAPTTCTAACRDIIDCSTPDVCRAADRLHG